MGAYTLDFKRLRQTVRRARMEARQEAVDTYAVRGLPFVRSRGTLLCTADNRGNQCLPNIAADCPVWTGTKREIEQLVKAVTTGIKYAHVYEVYIEGAFDAAEWFDFSDYKPRVTEWKVLVWRRGDGYAVPVAEVIS